MATPSSSRYEKNPDTEWIPILFLSAKGQSQDRVKGLNTGGQMFTWVKPFEPEELVAQVESSLKQASRLTKQQIKSNGGPCESRFPSMLS